MPLVRCVRPNVRFVPWCMDSAAASFLIIAEPPAKVLFGGGVMKFPRRQFLHLAAGAALLPAVSRPARAQTSPPRRLGGLVCPAYGAMDFRKARSVLRYREPARRRHQHRHRGGGTGRAGW